MSEPNYAGFWRRCLASLLDNLVWVLEVMIAAGKRKQRLGDLAAKTVVVRRAPRAATTERVAPPQNGSRSRAPSQRPSQNA